MTVELLMTQMLFTFGVVLNADETVTTAPAMPVIALVSTVPSGINTEIVALPVVGRLVSVVSSTVMVVVVAAAMRPPRRTPDLTGSAIEITAPGRTSTPASIDALNSTTSVS